MSRNSLRSASCLLAFLFTVGATAADLEIHYINVGWGSSVFVRGPDGTTMLLEAGNTGKGTAEVVPYLMSLGVLLANGLDYMIGGHQHCDHIGGLDEVIAAGYDVHLKQYYNGSATTSSCVTGWNAAAAGTTAGAPVLLAVGTVIQLGEGATATCVASNGTVIGGGTVTVSDENDRSLAILIQYGSFDYLWASDLGGGDADEACTARSTSQVDVESAVIAAISPGGAFPLISPGGIDVMNVNHHGSESSTNANWMNGARPAVAVIATGAGQSSNFQLPRIAVVENVLLASVACITVPATLVLQTEEGAPIGAETSTAAYSVGDIVIRTDGQTLFEVAANGAVNQGPNEVPAAGLPQSFVIDGLMVPQHLLATASSTSQVGVTWTPTADADFYEVFRSVNHAPFSFTGSTTAPPFMDSGLASHTTYLYTVRAARSTGEVSDYSNLDLATTTLFTDDPLQAQVTKVRAVHVTELRTAANAVRAAAGLAPYSFADSSLTGILVKATHVLELRGTLDAARAALDLPAASYTNTITAGITAIHASDIVDVRNAVK
jgi:beta-lactamase superfamily II metal-dependent hydrolase